MEYNKKELPVRGFRGFTGMPIPQERIVSPYENIPFHFNL